MISKQLLDIETLKKNCSHYANLHSKSIDVLRKASGKDDYKKIAQELSLHETKVSGLLKQAEKLGLATKKGKLYKKVSGILQYIPKSNKGKQKTYTISEVVGRTEKRKISIPSASSVDVNFRDNPAKMAKAYMWLYATENGLRELIRKTFEKEQDWWNKRVNDGIKKDVKDAVDKYPYDGAQRKDELEYTHLGQLKEIITAKNNWNVFQSFLKEKNKNSFQAIVDKAIPSRNSLAHCTPLTGEDFRFVEVRFKDILKML